MKAKKLTKREWFEAAIAWDSSGKQENYEVPFVDQDFVSEAAAFACGETGGYDNGNTPEDSCDRWFMYAQYCLERAGIPAGDR